MGLREDPAGLTTWLSEVKNGECECGGTAFVRVDDNAHYGWHGFAPCRCELGRLQRLHSLRVPAWVRRYLWKPFAIPARPRAYSAELARAVNIARGFARTIRRGETRWLIMDGDNGSGKTHLACHLVAAAQIENLRLRTMWYTEADWLTWCYRAARPVASEEDAEVERARNIIGLVREADLILVDEWLAKTGGYTTVAAQHLCELFKLSELHPKTLVLTTNVPLPTATTEVTCKDDRSVPVLDGRVVDRLHEYAVRLEMPKTPEAVNHRAKARRENEAQALVWAKGE